MPTASTKNPHSLLAIDLFCGAGGLSEGLRQAGFEVVGAVDLNPLACATYRMNHRKTRVWQQDLRRLTALKVLNDLEIERGRLDLLAACPPCQGFSTMRTRNGVRRNRDKRNGLILEVLRMVRVIRPRAVMLENVPGLQRDRRYHQFRNALIALGYDVVDAVLNVADYHVPQKRRRLVLLAARSTAPEFAKASATRRTVRSALKCLRRQRRRSDPLHDYSTNLTMKVRSLIRQIPKNGGSRSDLGLRRQLKCHRRFDGFRDVYGRMAWNQPSPTITGGCINPSKGRFIHPTADRPITLREAALLQSFPMSYRFCLDRGRYATAEMIGNALPPEFIRRHAVALRTALER